MSVYKDVNKPNRDEGRLLYTSLQKDVSFDHQQTRKVDLQNDMSYSVSQNDLLLQLSQLVECLAFSPNPCLQGCHWRWVFVVGLPKLWLGQILLSAAQLQTGNKAQLEQQWWSGCISALSMKWKVVLTSLNTTELLFIYI